MSATIYGDADWLAPSGALGIGIRFQDGHLAWSDATGSISRAKARLPSMVRQKFAETNLPCPSFPKRGN